MMSTVLTTTLEISPPRTGSEIMGRVSLTIMLAMRRVTRRRWPFLRMGWIFRAYSFCFLSYDQNQLVRRESGTYGVPLMLSTLSCVSSRLIYPGAASVGKTECG